MEEKRQKVAAFITELDIEKQKIERDQATTTEWYQTWITQSEKQHYENSKKIEDGKKLATNMQQTYHGYLKKLSESISRLKANEKPDMERRSLNEYKRDFIDAIGKQQVPQALLAVSMTENSATVKARPSFISEFESFDSRENKKYKRSGANEFNIYKVLTIVLVFLLLSAVAFGCFFMEIVM
ncbi:hypothetical protein [Niabella hibiscisoli]|uniref:hypothetical protein n=1 Tax=Niabella hibiscisoli TaxID=1825928 RepID=UPI001F0D9652|nr:hypothetical protein [Niabella hibiscisoli]MCH5718558.1 hypothetical protein [Niabella hibiscisoli]